MHDSVPSPRYSAICNVLRQWKTSLIRTYRVYRLYDITQGYNNYQRKGRNITFQLIMTLCMLSTVICSHGTNVIEPRRTVPCSTVRHGSALVHTAILTFPYRTVPYRTVLSTVIATVLCRVNTV